MRAGPEWFVHSDVKVPAPGAAHGLFGAVTDVDYLAVTCEAGRLVLARYAIPGVSGRSSNPVISPDGAQLAFQRSSIPLGGTWLPGIGKGPAPPR